MTTRLCSVSLRSRAYPSIPFHLLPGAAKRSHSMHRVRLLLTAGLLSVAGICQAQTATGETLMLDLPRASQHAQIVQRIGITDITINYHRPLANGRQIWGKVVPYDRVWRAGANENTTITFSDPVTIEGQALDKGTYGLHMIPALFLWFFFFLLNSSCH